MKALKNTQIALLALVLLLVAPSVNAQELKTDTLCFSIVKMKDGTLFIGKIIEKNTVQMSFRDNTLGVITIPTEKTRYIYEENLENLYLIVLENGNKITGHIVAKRTNNFDFKTTNLGTLTLKAEQVHEMKIIQEKSVVEGTYYFPNPNATRYFFAPSAIPLKKGEGYYQNAYILANSGNIGVTNNVSMGGGLILPVAAFISPKFGFEVAKNFYLGGGTILGIVPESEVAGIFYGVATVGSIEHNVTLAGGYGYFEGEFTENPIVTLNASTRISRQIALVTENWFVSLDDYNSSTNKYEAKYHSLITYGVRFMWDRFTIDAAFANNADIAEEFFIGIPYIDFVVKF